MKALKSTNGGATFSGTIVTVSLPDAGFLYYAVTGSRAGQTTLSKGDLLRLDTGVVNGASDWSFQLYTKKT